MALKKKLLTFRYSLCTYAGIATMFYGAIHTAEVHAAEHCNAQPKLFLSILVEGLDDNYVSLLGDYFRADGFNRIINHGLTVDAVDFGSNADAVSATAMLMTGAGGGLNGIVSSRIFDVPTREGVSVLADDEVLGNFSSLKISPKNIASSTLSDELRIATSGVGKAYGISADAEQAIILAGHAGNSALWIDNANSQWATSTYYKEAPSILSKINYGTPIVARLDTMRWVPGKSSLSLPLIPDSKRNYPFSYSFKSRDKFGIRDFKLSPKGNTEVTDIAIAQLEQLNLQDDAPDMLGVYYNLSTFPSSKSADNRHEVYDSYLKLDYDLSRLLEAADSHAGKGNYMVLLCGVPSGSGSKRDDDQWRIPGGTFSPKRAGNLLNMYLMAIFGNGEWWIGYSNKQFYLNAALAKSRKIDITSLRKEAAEFLSKVSGIRTAVTQEYALEADNLGALNPALVGDIFIEVSPGWEISNDGTSGENENFGGVERMGALNPLYIIAPGLEYTHIDGKVDARRVAPTVARLLRIRAPNAASEPPLK